MIQNEPLSVTATITRSSPHAPEQQAHISITTPSGCSCQLDIARVKTTRVTHVEVIGPHGRIHADWTNGLLQTFDHERLTSQELIPATPTLVLMLKDFFHALQTDQAMPISGEESLRAVALAEVCLQAAESGQTILCPYPASMKGLGI